MCTKPTSLRERKKARTRQALVDAALRLFAERGFEATTVADIADAADVSPRTFFTYFPAKEDVLFAGAKDRIERLRDALAKRAPDESFLDALRRAARDILTDPTFQAEAQRTHMQVIGANPALGARALQDLLAAEQVVAAAIAADLGMDQTDLQPQVAAAAAVNALRGAFMAWFLSGASGDPQPAFDQALDLLEHGLGSLSAVRQPPSPLLGRPSPFGQRRARRRGGATQHALTCRPTKRPPAATLANDPAHHPHHELPPRLGPWNPPPKPTCDPRRRVIDPACSRRRHQSPNLGVGTTKRRTGARGPARHTEAITTGDERHGRSIPAGPRPQPRQPDLPHDLGEVVACLLHRAARGAHLRP